MVKYLSLAKKRKWYSFYLKPDELNLGVDQFEASTPLPLPSSSAPTQVLD